MAGFPFGPQPIWSRLHTVELASYRLRKPPTEFPPLEALGGFPHGLTGRVSESSPRHTKSRIPIRGIRDFVSKWRDSNPRPFGPEPKIWSVFPVISTCFRNFPPTPVFSSFFRLFPSISANFQTVLNWTFGIFFTFISSTVRCNRSGCTNDGIKNISTNSKG